MAPVDSNKVSIVDLIKKNMASISVVVTFITAIVGGAFTVESRYAKASDYAELRTYVQQSRDYDRWDQRQQSNQSRKQQLEDQIFILRLKQHPVQEDKALIARYQEQLNAINAQLNQPSPVLPK